MNLLNSIKYLKWSHIDSVSAGLKFNYNDPSHFYKVGFNEKGEITQLETKRYMAEDNLEKWIEKLSNYKKSMDIKCQLRSRKSGDLKKGILVILSLM